MHPRSADSDLSESAVQNHSVGVTSDASEATSNEKSGEPLDSHRELKHEIQRLYQLLEVQNKEINHNSEEIKKMNESFHHLHDRIMTLEKTVHGQHHSDSVAAVPRSDDRTQTANLISEVTRRVNDLENIVHENTPTSDISDVRRQQDPHHNTSANSVKKHLILGDTNLSNLKVSDLSESWGIRTISESNFDLMRCWVREKLSWSPATCIIYGGLFDILEDCEYPRVLDNLGALISELKIKNENMDIYISQLVPSLQSDTLQAKINDLNEHLQKWSNENGIPIVKPDPLFRLGDGSIDEACYHAYGQHQGSILVRLGATRLLRAMADQCTPLKENINRESLKKHLQTHNIRQYTNKQTQRTPGHLPSPQGHQMDNQDSDGWIRAGRRRGTSGHTHKPASPPHRYNPPYHPPQLPGTRDRDLTTPGGTPEIHWRQDNDRAAGEGIQRGAVGPPTRPSRHTTRPGSNDRGGRYTHANTWRGGYTHNNNRSGCYNCGEYNHHQSRCRFDHKILCTHCNTYGHKSRLCHHYNY